jgi:hypothetical protein
MRFTTGRATRPLLAPLTIVAVAVAACGGSIPATTAPSLAATSAATAAATAVATAAASAPASVAPSVAASVAPGATATAAAGPIDISEAADLSGVNSYKLVVTTTGGDTAGTATFVTVRRPVLARSFEGSFGGQTTRIIVIGQDVWVDSGGGQWTKNLLPLSAAESLMSAFDPAALFLGIGTWADMGGLQQVGIEERNGVQTVHYHLDATTLPPGASIDPEAQVDLWIAADGGYVVSMRTSGMSDPDGPTSVAMDISNINDPGLTVTPPS